MAVTTLIWQVTTEFDAVSLFGGDGRAMHVVLGPLRSSLNPFDKPPGMLAPLRVLFRMQENVTGKLKRYHLVHVPHTGHDILEIAYPGVVGERVFLKPVPGAGAYLRVASNIALLQANEFVEQHD